MVDLRTVALVCHPSHHGEGRQAIMDDLGALMPLVIHGLVGWGLFIGLLALALAHEWMLAKSRRHMCSAVRRILMWTATTMLGCKAVALIVYSLNGVWHLFA
jgi:hypothetical protein